MPRGKNCRETIVAAQLPHNYPHRGGNFESGSQALSDRGEAIWEAFLGEGNREAPLARKKGPFR